jgi:hypothetical protein
VQAIKPRSDSPWHRFCAGLQRFGARLRRLCQIAAIGLLVLSFVAIEVGLAYLREKLLMQDAVNHAMNAMVGALDEDSKARAEALVASVSSQSIDWWSLGPQMILGAAVPLVLTLIAAKFEPFGESMRVIGVHRRAAKLRGRAANIARKLAKMDDKEARDAAKRTAGQAGTP